ncbi:hypothetical protein GCM10009850_039120 [Nonomuraea monospora]|uniref:Uncharacterized protein n=1 Tax=Nonomuraea monospora TaxID=568818 RepID=A0ABN3CGZ7_9ACTN
MRLPTAACVALTVLLTSCGFGTEQRVLRSLTEMERFARTIGPEDDLPGRSWKIGEAEFQSVHRAGDRVYFQVGENGPSVDPYGYVWSPERAPIDDSEPAVTSAFEHVQGPWYRWSDSY